MRVLSHVPGFKFKTNVSGHSSEYTYMKDRMSTCILHHLQAYYELTTWEQLPTGLIAQLVERCTGIAEVMSSNLFQASPNVNFQALIFTTISVVNCCDEQPCLHIYDLSYIHLYLHHLRVILRTLNVGLTAQLVKRCTSIAEVMGLKSRSGPLSFNFTAA